MSRKKGTYQHSKETKNKIKNWWSIPENKEYMCKVRILTAKNPEVRKKICDGVKRAWTRNKVKWSNKIKIALNQPIVVEKRKLFRHSSETKAKIAYTMKRKIKSGEVCNAFSPGVKHSRANLNKKLSPEVRRKISENTKKAMKSIDLSGKNNPNYGKTQGKEIIAKRIVKQKEWYKNNKNSKKLRLMYEKISRKVKAWRQTQSPVYTSSIEIKVQNFLKQLGIDFFTHQYLNIKHGYQCDILIPKLNLVIECDGNYWHKYPVGKDIDYIRTKELIEKGFRVLRLWESEINDMKIKDFENRLICYQR